MAQTLPRVMTKAKQTDNPFFLELYKIALRTETLYIVAADEDIVFNGQKFTAVPVKRGEITKSMDSVVNEVDLEVSDCSDELLAFLINGFDFRGCRVDIVRILYPDSLTDSSVFSWVFSGEIDKPSFSDGVFTCTVESKLPNIEAPVRDFQVACNSEFGDAECCMSRGTLECTVTRGRGNQVNIGNAYPKDYWKYGTITIGGEARNIISSKDGYVVVNANFLQDINGKTAEVNRGCNMTFDWCKKLGNTKHYSGFPAVPWEAEYR